MAIRRSSITLAIIGVLLIAVAAVIRYVAVPELSKLPEDTNATALFEGTLRQLDPATFRLDAGVPVTIDRTVKVDQVVGDTAVVTSTAVTHLPSGDTTDAHTYAISRDGYTQTDPPPGTQVEDQHGGITLSFPMNPTIGDTLVYDSVTRASQPVKYIGTSNLDGREVLEFAGTATAPIADPAVLSPVKAAIAGLAQSGDGSTLPKAMLQSLLAALPTDRASEAQRVLESAPDQVPLAYTSVNSMALSVDSRFGAPIKMAQDQTIVLNLQSNGASVPLLDLSQAQVATSDASIYSTAASLAKGERQLDIVGLWVPLGAALLGSILIIAGTVRRHPRDRTDSGEGTPHSPANVTPPQPTRARG